MVTILGLPWCILKNLGWPPAKKYFLERVPTSALEITLGENIFRHPNKIYSHSINNLWDKKSSFFDFFEHFQNKIDIIFEILVKIWSKRFEFNFCTRFYIYRFFRLQIWRSAFTFYPYGQKQETCFPILKYML